MFSTPHPSLSSGSRPLHPPSSSAQLSVFNRADLVTDMSLLCCFLPQISAPALLAWLSRSGSSSAICSLYWPDSFCACGTRSGKENSPDNSLVVFPRTEHRTWVSTSQADNADGRHGRRSGFWLGSAVHSRTVKSGSPSVTALHSHLRVWRGTAPRSLRSWICNLLAVLQFSFKPGGRWGLPRSLTSACAFIEHP